MQTILLIPAEGVGTMPVSGTAQSSRKSDRDIEFTDIFTQSDLAISALTDGLKSSSPSPDADEPDADSISTNEPSDGEEVAMQDGFDAKPQGRLALSDVQPLPDRFNYLLADGEPKPQSPASGLHVETGQKPAPETPPYAPVTEPKPIDGTAFKEESFSAENKRPAQPGAPASRASETLKLVQSTIQTINETGHDRPSPASVPNSATAVSPWPGQPTRPEQSAAMRDPDSVSPIELPHSPRFYQDRGVDPRNVALRHSKLAVQLAVPDMQSFSPQKLNNLPDIPPDMTHWLAESNQEISQLSRLEPTGARWVPTTTTAGRLENPLLIAQNVSEAIRIKGNGSMELQLHPEELGRVRLQFGQAEAGGALSVAVSAEKPDTLELLRRNIHDLGRELNALGFDDVAFSFDQNKEKQGKALPLAPDQPSQPEPTTSEHETPPMNRTDGSLADGIDIRL